MSLPLAVILKEIESTPGSITPILASLHYNRSIFENISKSDLNHLVSRSLNLAKSNVSYNKWCGINLLNVLSDDYTILSEYGSVIIAQLLKTIEQQTATTSILSSSIECLKKVCDAIRGKPTLTREILTPKLPSVITGLLDKINFAPNLALNFLQSLIKAHPTTFRPFGNKLKSRLLEFIIAPDFKNFPASLKKSIYRTLAILPIIEKADPDLKWNKNVVNLVNEAVQIVLIYREFLQFQDDQELSKRVNNFQVPEENIFTESLRVDLSDSKSLFLVSERFSILLELISGYLTTETSYPVRVPIGQVLTLIDIICSVNTKFLSFRNDVFDNDLKQLVKLSLSYCHESATRLLLNLPNTFGKLLLPHLNNTLSSLETLIPFANKKIDKQAIRNSEPFMCQLLICASEWLRLTSQLTNASILLRMIEVALILVEPKSIKKDSNSQKNGNQNGKKNKKTKKNGKNAAAMSDLLSHENLFIIDASEKTITIVREFIHSVITRVNVPPTQYYRIFRYVLIEAVNAKRNEAVVPDELKSLLVDSIIYPGLETASILPLVSNILPHDPVLSVFNNPRFPPLPILISKMSTIEANQIESESESEEEKNDIEPESSEHRLEREPEKIDQAFKKQKLETPIIDSKISSSIFKDEIQKKPVISEQVLVDTTNAQEVSKELPATSPKLSIQKVTQTSISKVSVDDNNKDDDGDDDDNSDFEMPTIEVDGDDSD